MNISTSRKRARRALRKTLRQLSLLSLPVLAVLWALWDPQMSPQPDSVELSGPDYIVNDFEAIAYSPSGQWQRQLQGQEMQYFDDAQSATLLAPHITLFDDNGAPQWKIQADNGVLQNEAQILQLEHNAQVEQPQKQLQINSEALQYDLQKELLISPGPVHIQAAIGEIRANSMQASIANGELELRGAVEVSYVSP